MLFILEFLPSWVFLSLFVISVLGYALTYLMYFIPSPIFYIYKTPIQIAFIVLIIFATFMYGSAYNNKTWKTKIEEIENKVTIAEERAERKNVNIQEKITESIKEIKIKGDTIIKQVQVPGPERIKEIIKNMSEEEKKTYESKITELENSIKNCSVPQLIIESHNEAATILSGKK